MKLILKSSMTLAGLALLLFATQPPALAIIGGDPRSPLQSHLVMIVSDHGSLCSGVVIERRVILTAAHCVSGGGSYRLHWRDETNQPVLVEPAQIIRHPAFQADAAKTRQRSIDLAIVTSKQDLPAFLTPAPLSDGATPPPAKNTALTLAGYGLRQERDPNSAGQFAHVTLPVIMPYGQGRILVWLGGKQAGACAGDSGGGIFTASGALIALTVWSEGEGQNKCGAITQGLLIAPQRAFIDKELGRLRPSP
jgi:hypothetical protein